MFSIGNELAINSVSNNYHVVKDKAQSENSSVLVERVINSSEIMGNDTRRDKNFFGKNLPDLESPSLVRSVMAIIQKGHSDAKKNTFDKVKDKYNEFLLSTTKSVIDFERFVEKNKHDLPVALKNIENVSGVFTLTNKLNACVLNKVRTIEKDIETKLNAFKSSIGDGRGFDNIGRARLKSLEDTADVFAKRALSKVNGMTLPLN